MKDQLTLIIKLILCINLVYDSFIIGLDCFYLRPLHLIA